MDYGERTKHPFLRTGLPALVALITFAAFTPALFNEFVNLDDDRNFRYNTKYRGFSAENLKWMLTDMDGHYLPIQWLTHGLDWVLWGLEPAGYHLINMLLHALNAVLFYFVLYTLLRVTRVPEELHEDRALRWACFVGALLFSIHPLRVESVAWATQRRDVLFLFFLLPSILLYLKTLSYEEWNRKRVLLLIGSLFFYALSLLSKPFAMTLPLLLLIIDAYPYKRFAAGNRKLPLVLEKLPYFALAGAAIVIEILAQSTGGTIKPFSDYGITDMVSQPGFRFCFYIYKMIVPVGLYPMYLLPLQRDPVSFLYIGCTIGAIVGTLAVWYFAYRKYGVMAAWFGFALLLSPVLGIVQAGPHFAADRYMYLPMLPFAALAAGALYSYWWRGQRTGQLAVLSGVVLAGCALLTVQQTMVWKDSITLWKHTIRHDPDNYMAHYNLAHALTEAEEFEAAEDHYTTASRLNPNSSQIWYNLGNVHLAIGEWDQAIHSFTRAVQNKETHYRALSNRGYAKMKLEKYIPALKDIAQAVEIKGEDPQVHVHRALVLTEMGTYDRAIQSCDTALKLHEGFTEALIAKGDALFRRGDADQAVAILLTTVDFRPFDNRLMDLVARVYQKLGDPKRAVKYHNKALFKNSHYPEAYLSFGLYLEELGQTEAALEVLQSGYQIARQNWKHRGAMAKHIERLRGSR